MNFMYKYIDLNGEIYLGYTIFCLYHLYIIHTCHAFLLLKDTSIIIFMEKPNCFKYHFKAIHYFFLLSIMQHESKLSFVRGSAKGNYCQKYTYQQL